MITIEQIKESISEAITQSGLTQREIAQKLGVYQSTVSQYRTGKRIPSLEMFGALCKILDVDANEILCINEWRSSR